MFTDNDSIYKGKTERSRPVGLQNKALSQAKEEKRKGNWGEQRRRGRRKGRGEGKRREGRDRRRERKAEEGRQDEITVINFQTDLLS